MTRFRSMSALIAAAAIVLAGCGEGTDSTPSPSASSAATPSASASSSAAPGGFELDPAAAALGTPAPVALLNNHNGPTGVFLYTFGPGLTIADVEQVDYTPGGAPGNMLGVEGDVAWDGVQVAFRSFASDVVAGDTNGVTDIFLKNVSSGAAVQVSDGLVTDWDWGSDSPAISADGSSVVFRSSAVGLVPGVASTPQVYLYTVLSGELLLASIDPDSQANFAYDPAVSAGGRYVAYASAENGEFGGDNVVGGVYVLDTDMGEVELVSVASDGTPADYLSAGPSLSLDGRYVAFHSKASNLDPGFTNAFLNVYVHDRETGATTLVTKNAAGQPANNDSQDPEMVGNGTGVVFWSYASDLVPGDTNGDYDVFYADLATGAIERINTSGGVEANGFSKLDGVYGGRYVVFWTYATNLGGDGDDGPEYWYVYDLETDTLTKLK
jgi:hypothetical protein